MTDTPADEMPADEMPEEPTGTTIDGTPWEEARPPHLPDKVTGTPLPAFVFFGLAVVVTVQTLRDAQLDPSLSPSILLGQLFSIVAPAVAFLLPAMLFLRHRDAWQAHRAIAIGAILIGLSQGLGLLSAPLQPVFESISPASAETAFVYPSSIAYSVFVAMVSVIGVAFVGRGLVDARVYEDVDGTRRWWVVVVVTGFIAAALRIFALGNIPTDIEAESLAAYYWITLIGVITSTLAIVAWAYLAGNGIAGRLAGERPGAAWLATGIAGQTILFAFIVGGLISMVAFVSTPLPIETSLTTTGLYAIGHVFLLIAFMAGLPTSHEPEPEDVVEEPAEPESVPG
jgi:hypothetical protein